MVAIDGPLIDFGKLCLKFLHGIAHGSFVPAQCGKINRSEVHSKGEVVLTFDFSGTSFPPPTSKAWQGRRAGIKEGLDGRDYFRCAFVVVCQVKGKDTCCPA